jgi:hypothetical protein
MDSQTGSLHIQQHRVSMETVPAQQWAAMSSCINPSFEGIGLILASAKLSAAHRIPGQMRAYLCGRHPKQCISSEHKRNTHTHAHTHTYTRTHTPKRESAHTQTQTRTPKRLSGHTHTIYISLSLFLTDTHPHTEQISRGGLCSSFLDSDSQL